MNKPILIGAGELLWDMLPGGKQLGGAPANFAWHASQLGGKGIVYSAVGTDEPGNEIVGFLDQKKMDTRFISRLELYPTGKVDVRLDASGVPEYTIQTDVAWDKIPLCDQRQEVIANASAFCFGALAQRDNVSFTTIQSLLDELPENCLKIFDINLRQHFYSKAVIELSLQKCDVLKLNEDELPVVAELFGMDGEEKAILEQLLTYFNIELIALTKGGAGSLILTKTERSWLESPKVNIADTVGAGDSFTAALAMGLLKKRLIKDVHQAAVEVSAYVCTQKGAMPQLPKELSELFAHK
ncbi:carbohydrate kinase [Maribellus sp. YY47]|uniref:carbohydrate kinase family protein n=1 Tax=Maribellus sp. YY47 TaxID=2929486 RepID=UPI002001B50A|nr:carbohydrate kinase [Maribellus sp. YY47]MCK3684834.1 carbohydrate kinase [Maribellus sp. YY47]